MNITLIPLPESVASFTF